MENDYSLLRRLDLGQARQGAELCTADGQPVKFRAYQAARLQRFSVDKLFYDYPTESDIFMAPLGWIEGRPVYKGDVLFHKIQRGKYVIDGKAVGAVGGEYRSGCVGLAPGGLTWGEPVVAPGKILREGWVNIYPERRISRMYELEKEAGWNSAGDRIACARIKWEEKL